MILGKLICRITGKHKRRRVVKWTVGADLSADARMVKCPRCGAMWVRKVKVRA